MTTFADKAIGFFQSLHFPFPLPPSIQVMNPYQHSATFEIVRTFFGKFYADTVPRIFFGASIPGASVAALQAFHSRIPLRYEHFWALNMLFQASANCRQNLSTPS